MIELPRRQIADASVARDFLAAVVTVLGKPEALVALHEPEFAGREWEYVKDCIDIGWVSSTGAYVDRFERALADYTGSPFAVAVVNGTAGLHLALQLSGVRPNDEVIVPALTFVATANAVSYCGAIPHFVDVALPSLGIDAEKLDRHLTDIISGPKDRKINRLSGRRVAGVVLMHAFGHPADLEKVIAVCARHELPLIEDAAESLGSTSQGRHCGTFAPISALSFNGNKIVTTGGGGAILTADAALAKRAKHLSTTAKLPHPWLYLHDEVGFNYRMPNLNAALGCAQLERIEEFVAAKRKLAAAYERAFSHGGDVTFLREPAGTRSNFWLCTALLPEDSSVVERDDVLAQLNAANYMVRPAWTLMHRLAPYYAAPRMPDLACAEGIERRLINLPSTARLGRAL